MIFTIGTRHVLGIIDNFESFTKQDSDLEFDSIEALDIKFNLLINLSGWSFCKLPDKLNQMKAVINVDTRNNCFKYALLCIIQYSDVRDHRTVKVNMSNALRSCILVKSILEICASEAISPR